MTNLSIGDTVIYSTFGGTRRTVRVTGFGEKNGEQVFDGELLERTVGLEAGDSVWGYFSQVERVEKAGVN